MTLKRRPGAALSTFAALAADVCGYSDNLACGRCPTCGHADPANTIRDNISLVEFNLSGLCQDCQDRIFGGRLQ